jgi:hypothetical protein
LIIPVLPNLKPLGGHPLFISKSLLFPIKSIVNLAVCRREIFPPQAIWGNMRGY